MSGRGKRTIATFGLCVVALAAPTAGTAQGKGTRPPKPIALRGAHDCVPRRQAERGDARATWKKLKNPIFETDHMTKDEAIRLVDGRWELFFSERLGTDPESTRTGHWASTDLHDWSPRPPNQSWGSPDITSLVDGTLVITHQIQDPANPDISRIHATTARDPDGPWSTPVPLVPDAFPDERVIDAGLAYTRDGLFLMFKRGLHTATVQHVGVARSPSGSLAGPWEIVGEPDLPWSENFEFLPIDGTWHALVTTIPIHEPALYRLVGDPSDPQSWLHWKKVRTLEVPQESWNRGRTPGITHETANSAYLCDARRLDGYWYLFYAGSTELTQFEGRGHAKIGVARSKDLKHWKVPPH